MKPLKTPQDRYDMDDLIAMMKALRTPQTGCPWDLEQDFKSIAPYTIEEAYEVADAIERGDMNDLREELGDLLLQPVYHAQMASEAGHFDIEDVIHDITAKMITRHPHVFSDRKAKSASDVNAIWDERKAAEKSEQHESALDSVTKALPALLRAEKLLKKAGKQGFEWPSPQDILIKLEEELGELSEAVASGNQAHIEEEFGDVLFVLANYGQRLGFNPETALRRANDKFERRFRGMENDLNTEYKSMKDCSLPELLSLWEKQKKK
ncbi:MAG: nucleoside triphosphate pyrophosphohydrolase [Alphaproteobacteria bacterium]|nr:nucleoside triphosphate pyrophosphohydrolase [Alphaproteobacteria bacterium]MCD8526237.1 nucleoside triphosphate pyrophosphohydrolase [Alphaproteobacteria bacterium]MCD8570746.1 nucleoside triphosphate pyrophosphohydrolase [Alphaproteobacteria bacterium]